jgi:hypothetical protein
MTCVILLNVGIGTSRGLMFVVSFFSISIAFSYFATHLVLLHDMTKSKENEQIIMTINSICYYHEIDQLSFHCEKTRKKIKMVPTITCPATKALELQQHKTTTSKGSRRGCIDLTLSYELFSLNFNDNFNTFPVIEWDSNEDSDSLSDSSSVRSMESLNSVLTETDCSLGKRGRSKPKSSYRRLVRSKKIKSDLASLARDISTIS